MDLGNEVPIYGLEMEGSMLLESYTTTFSVLISLDGLTFSYITNIISHNYITNDYKQPKVKIISKH